MAKSSNDRNTELPQPGDTVAWKWAGGQPTGQVQSVESHDDAKIQTQNGNTVRRDGTDDDPAVKIKADSSGNDVIKNSHEVEVVEPATEASTSSSTSSSASSSEKKKMEEASSDTKKDSNNSQKRATPSTSSNTTVEKNEETPETERPKKVQKDNAAEPVSRRTRSHD